MGAVGIGVSNGDRNVGGDSVGSGSEVGTPVGDGVGKGDSKSEVGWRGKSGETVGVGDAVWVGGIVDVGAGSGDVKVGVVKFRVSVKVLLVTGKLGGEVGEGMEMRSEVEAIAKVGVGVGNTEGVMCRNATSVPVGVAIEAVAGAHPLTKAERQMVSKTAFFHWNTIRFVSCK